jgi:hypothetical protein
MSRSLFANITDAEIEAAFAGAQYDDAARDAYLDTLDHLREQNDGDESVYTRARVGSDA